MKRIAPLIAVMLAAMLLMTGCLRGKDSEADPNAQPVFQTQAGDDRIVGEFEVEVESVTIAEVNKGNVLVARIVYTNNTDTNVVFRDNLSVAMFQDGILLSDTSPSSIAGYDLDAARKTIKPGATLAVDLCFKPENLTSDVEVEVYVKGAYYVDAKATEKVRADYYGAVMALDGSQVSNTADTIAAERQIVMDEWAAEQARLAEEAAAAEAAKNKD